MVLLSLVYLFIACLLLGVARSAPLEAEVEVESPAADECKVSPTEVIYPKEFKYAEITDDLKSLAVIQQLFGIGQEGSPFLNLTINDPGVGTGPFAPVLVTTDWSLPGHVIYTPAIPHKEKLPVILWGEGLCINAGDLYRGFLTEIASHGFLVVASGGPAFQPDPVIHSTSDLLSVPGLQTLVLTAARLRDQGWITTPNAMIQVVDWVHRGGADKYGQIAKSKIMAAGQNCGAIEAYTAAYNEPRISHLSVFNGGLLIKKTRCMLSRLKVPVAYFLGGPYDVGAQMGEKDYADLAAGLPAVKLNLDTGSLGTYFTPHGGKYAEASIAYFKWVLKNDQEAKQIVMRGATRTPADSKLTKDGWTVTWKNFSASNSSST